MKYLIKKIKDSMLILGSIVFLALVAFFNFNISDQEHFSYLALSFIDGHFYFTNQPGATWLDTVLVQGRYYWPLGPFPSILLLPFVYVFNAYGLFFAQGYLQFFIIIAITYLIFAKFSIWHKTVRISFWLKSI